MTRRIAAGLLAAAALSLAGCGKKGPQDMPTADEKAGLANAAAIDTSPDSLVPGDNSSLGNGEDEEDEDLGNGA